jgi:acyl-CoA thioesterase
MKSDEIEALRRYFSGDRFAATTGVELVELRPGFAKARLKIAERHLNGVGIVHGGAVFTLADFAFAVACNSAGRVAVAVSTNLSFMKPTRSGTLWAEAIEVSRSRRISTCTVRVTNDDDELVALFQGTAYIKAELILAEKPSET